MSKRIKAIASYILPTDKVADIGSDQALLSIHLSKKGMPSIATDIKESIINRAKEKAASLNLSHYIDFRVMDGIIFLTKEEADTLVLAGMGAHTIIKILEKTKFTYKKIITISNNNHFLLRKRMLDLGYKISVEEIIYEKSKYYNLIIFIPGNTKYSERDLYIGLNHQNKKLLKKYNEELLTKNIEIYQKSKNKEIKKLIEILEKYKY